MPGAEPARAEDAEAVYRAATAHDLINALRQRVAAGERHNPIPGNPEAAANQVALFLDGFATALIRVAPDLVDEIAADVQSSLCSTRTSSAELITLSRLLEKMPEFANAEGIDCVLRNHPEEGIVLWEALSAWQISELPKSELIARIEASAQDERTQRRFLARGEQPVAAAATEVLPSDRPPAPINSTLPAGPN
jgi:hypothetical protein